MRLSFIQAQLCGRQLVHHLLQLREGPHLLVNACGEQDLGNAAVDLHFEDQLRLTDVRREKILRRILAVNSMVRRTMLKK
jgi:hypothetical protein